MKDELAKKLMEDFEPLYRNWRGPGFECGDGWYELLRALGEELCSNWIQAKNRLRRAEAKGEPTEELRRIEREAFERVPVAAQVKEKYGSLRFYADGLDDAGHSAVSLAERFSERVCEVCGDKGEPTKGGWIKCLCDRCRENQGLLKAAEEESF